MQITTSLPRLATAQKRNLTQTPPQDVPVNEDRLVDTFLHLTTIPGPTGDERKVADDIKAQVASLGLSAVEDDAGPKVGGNTGNLLVNIPGNVAGAPTLMFASHMDTVPLAVGCKPIQDGDIIKTDGSTALGGDCRAGCSELLEATREILENNLPHGPIQLVFSVGEEGGLLGAQEFDKSKVEADFIYALDGFSPNEIYVQGRHLLAAPEQPLTAEQVQKGHQALASHPPLKTPFGVALTAAEKKIMNFTADAMQDLGWEPQFHRIEWAASDANAFRAKGLNAITLGAGENNDHTGEEFVRISEMVKSTQLVKKLIANAAAQSHQ
jgi:di/tripeptidase